MLTHQPEWPGMTHYLCVHTETEAALDEDYTTEAITAAYRRLEAANPGRTYYEIGRDVCQRTDLGAYPTEDNPTPDGPWQLFIGLQEVANEV